MAYLKDAYEEIYKHPSWEKTAKDYETGFASNLYHAPFVRESARSVLVRFSKLFQTYYGIQDIKKKKQEDPLGFDDQAALADLAEEMSGDKIKYSPVLEDTLLAPENEDRSNGAGQIGNARRNVLPFDEEGDRKAEETNRKNIEDVINEDGNLREQMTMLYNAAFMNGGRTPEEIREGRSLKNLLVNLNRDDVEMIQEVGFAAKDRGLAEFMPNMNVIRDQEHYKEKGDVFDPVPFATRFQAANDKYNFKREKRKGWWKRFTDKVSKGWFAFWHRRKYRDRPIPGLGIEHYTKNNMPLSQREQEYGVDKETKLLKWQEGGSFMRMRKTVTSKGMLQITGPSGTTMRMLGAYKMLGASKNDLMYFRLALIAWLCGSRDHSLFEVLKGSWMAGIKGKEDTSEAARMYQTIDPLSTAQIRINYAPNKEFPHETVYKIMLEELKQARKEEFLKMQERQARKGRPIADREESDFSLISPEYDGKDAGSMAINVYTQNTFFNMAINTKFGLVRYLGLKNIGLSNFTGNVKTRDKAVDDKGNRRFVSGSDIYNGSAKYEAKNSKLLDQIYTMIRLSARMTDDAVQERTRMLDSEAIELQRSPGVSGYVFRGERKGSRHKSGGFTTDKLTSTSVSPETAFKFSKGFFNTFLGSGIVSRMLLHGSGVYVGHISANGEEQEVLLPLGVQFRLTKTPRLVKINNAEDNVEDLTREEIRLVPTQKNKDNPLHDKKVFYAADFEEVSSRASDERKQNHAKRMNKMVMLLEKRKKRLGVLQEEGKQVEELLKVQKEAIKEANVPLPNKDQSSGILDELFEPAEIAEMDPKVQKKENDQLKKIEEQEKKMDVPEVKDVQPVNEALPGGGSGPVAEGLKQAEEDQKGKKPSIEDEVEDELTNIFGMLEREYTEEEVEQKRQELLKEKRNAAVKEEEPEKEEPKKEEPKKEEPIIEERKSSGSVGEHKGELALLLEEIEKERGKKLSIEEEVENELNHMFGMLEREVTDEEVEQKRKELLAQKRGVRLEEAGPGKDILSLSGSSDSIKILEEPPKKQSVSKSVPLYKMMRKVFATNNGYKVFEKIQSTLEKMIKEGAGKKVPVHTADESVWFLANAAAKDEILIRMLRSIFESPFATSNDRKERVRELKDVMTLVREKLGKTGLSNAASESGISSSGKEKKNKK